MANGEPFNPDAMTCASWFYRFGTRLVVTSGGKSVIVTVTDRGPNRRFLKTRRRRIIDLSRAAFARLSSLKIGLIPISVKTLDRR
jgi:rare lipoprotein A